MHGPFPVIWLAFLIGTGVALMVISQNSPIVQEMAGVSPLEAGGAVTLLAIANGLGRPSFGAISDKIGRKNTLLVAFAIEIIALIFILPNATTLPVYAIGIILIGFTYGGFLGLMPSLTADYFGSKNIGLNYAWIYTAYGKAYKTLCKRWSKDRSYVVPSNLRDVLQTHVEIEGFDGYVLSRYVGHAADSVWRQHYTKRSPATLLQDMRSRVTDKVDKVFVNLGTIWQLFVNALLTCVE